jgi:D-alanine-D-alanine ligase
MKPLAGGSSRGLHFISRNDAIPEVRIPYILEQFISGRELTIGVIDRGDGKPLALPVIEIELDAGRAFDYTGKYLGHGTREICPARIPDSMRDEAQHVALTAHQALGLEGYSRSDVIAADDGIYYLETNTLPGLTAQSLVPQQLREAGIEFRTFLDEQLALSRRRSSTHAVR